MADKACHVVGSTTQVGLTQALAPMKISKLILAASIGLTCTTAISQSSKPVKIKAFEFLGCSGDWNGKLTKPEVWRISGEGQVTFLTHHVATCGLSGRNPKATQLGDSLDLRYELRSPSEAVILCDCEYWAKFSMPSSAAKYTSATLNGEQAVLHGDWPGR